MYEDKTLVCKECGNEFVFTAGEQPKVLSSYIGFYLSSVRCCPEKHLIL